MYQADWLLRFYGFTSEEITVSSDGMLDLDVDPKLAWALAHREQFPVDINTASREQLLRVPGLGRRTVERILEARKVRRIHADDLRRLAIPIKRVLPFIKVPGSTAAKRLDSTQIDAMFRAQPQQLFLNLDA